MNKHREPIAFRVRSAASRFGHRAIEYASMLTSPIEAGFSYLGRLFISATDGGDRFESLVSRIASVLVRPFQIVWQFASIILSVAIPLAVRRATASWYESFVSRWQRLVQQAISLAERINLDKLAIWFAWLLQPLWRPVFAVVGFSYAWCVTRDLRRLLRGWPVLLVIAPSIGLLGRALVLGNTAIIEQYKLAVREAVANSDYRRSAFFERKLVQFGADTKLTDFRTAVSLAKSGSLRDAYARMQRLAPLNEPGYPPAHFWIIQQLLAGRLDVSPTDTHQLAGVHFDHLKTLRIKSPELDVFRAHWIDEGGRSEEALEILKPLIAQLPLAAIERLRLDVKLGRESDARHDALAVREHMLRQQRDNVQLTNDDYQWWAITEKVLGDRTRYESVVIAWTKLDDANDASRQEFANLRGQEFDELLASPNHDPAALESRLREGFAAAEVPADLRQKLSVLYQTRTTRPELVILFDRLSAAADLPPLLTAELGTAAALAGDWAHAESYLTRATDQNPDDAVAWNNLACVLRQQSKPDLEQALKAVNLALEIKPRDFRFRETRGQVLAGLGRWNDCVNDLEFALNGMPDAREIHGSLAKAYDALGDKQLADVHRRYAN